MNGVRSTYMRKGYLLTALAAAVLLAASSGTAYAQRVTIGFVDTSGEISEKASLDANSPEAPQMITVRVRGLLPGDQRTEDIGRNIPTVNITPSKPVYIAVVDSDGNFDKPAAVSERAVAFVLSTTDAENRAFDFSDELVLMVAQSDDGSGDGNWVDEKIELKLTIVGTASVSPDVFTLTAKDANVAPAAKFKQPDFTLSEESERTVELDIVKAPGTASVPAALAAVVDEDESPYSDVISVRVSNQRAVVLSNGTTTAISHPADGLPALFDCPGSTDARYNTLLYHIDITDEWTQTNFVNTGVLQTVATIGGSGAGSLADEGTAKLVITGCGDKKGIADPRITLTILETNLSEQTPSIGDITIGAPLTISTDSDEALPTLSFSPTDVEIDEGGSTSTVLLAEGKNSGDVKMVKLSVEGDAMVSLMQDGEMLEEMDGHVYVDLGGSSSARLMAMSHSDPDLMDGDMAFKAWKLTDYSAEGVDIGEGYWFKVDVRGSTAVPALPLLGQLLLALFLMAGGARLYRRRQG